MAKVLPLTGAPSAELIHAAFGQARAMELGVVPFRKLIQVTNGTFQFRRDADGRVTAFVEELTNKSYQFFTTGPQVLTGTGTGDLAGILIYRGYSIKVNLLNAAAKAKAIASSAEVAPDEEGKPPRWKFVTPEAVDQEFPRKGIFQVQAAPEHQYFAKDPKEKSRTGVATYPMMVDSLAQDTAITNLGYRGSTMHHPQSAIDVGYDVAPSVFKAGAELPTVGEFEDAPNTVAKSAFVPDADWPKRAAFVSITHAVYGTRLFCVLSDISNEFHVYPADAPLSMAQLHDATVEWPGQAIKTAIPAGFVRSAAAPLPAWCRVGPTEKARDSYRDAWLVGDVDNWDTKYRVTTPQYRWAFNSTCTKACAVVFEDIPGIPLDDENSTIPQRDGDGPVEESLPGLVELGLHIAITGGNPEDFTFSLTLERELQPTVTKDYVMAADYAWVVKQGGANITDLDDLILLKGAIYHTSDERQLAGPPHYPFELRERQYPNALKGVVTAYNHTQGTDLRKFLVADTALPYASTRTAQGDPYSLTHWALPYWEAIGLIVAYDLRILAFVVQQRLIVQDLSTNVAPNFTDRHQGVYKACQRVLVYAHNELAQEKKMDPDSPLNTQLVERFEATGTDALFLYPVDDVGDYHYKGPINEYEFQITTAYRQMDLMCTRWNDPANNIAMYWYGVYNDTFVTRGGSFNAGPFLYGTRIANTLRCGTHESFTVFADGSWSVVTAPFYYYSGAGTDMLNKWPNANRPRDYTEQIDLTLMKQDMVDIINFRITNPKTGAVRDVRTTHLAMANKALGKTWTKQDFMCEFSFEEGSAPESPGRLVRHLVATTQTPAADDRILIFKDVSLHIDRPPPIGSGNPAYLDIRQHDGPHMYAYSGPVLRGASLFY